MSLTNDKYQCTLWSSIHVKPREAAIPTRRLWSSLDGREDYFGRWWQHRPKIETTELHLNNQSVGTISSTATIMEANDIGTKEKWYPSHDKLRVRPMILYSFCLFARRRFHHWTRCSSTKHGIFSIINLSKLFFRKNKWRFLGKQMELFFNPLQNWHYKASNFVVIPYSSSSCSPSPPNCSFVWWLPSLSSS